MVDWWVPILAGFVGGLLPAGVAIYAQAKQNEDRIKQREHEVDLEDARLKEERAQSHRDAGTSAYVSLAAAVDRMHPALFDTVDDSAGLHRIVDRADAVLREAQLALSTIRLHGWTPEIRTAAKDAALALADLYNEYYRHWILLDSAQDTTDEERQAEVAASEERVETKRRNTTSAGETLADAIGS